MQVIRRTLMVAGAGALVLACASSDATDDHAEQGATWPATTQTEATLGIHRWEMRVPSGNAPILLVGRDPSGSAVVTAALTYAAGTTTLSLPEGAIELHADGSIGANTLPTTTSAAWDKVLLASILDRMKSTGTEVPSATSTLSLKPTTLVGSTQLVQPASQPLVAGCRGGWGESAMWSASQAALGCTSTSGDDIRAQRDGYPFDATLVRAGNFDASSSRCAESAAQVSSGGDTRNNGCNGAKVQLVGFGQQLLDRALCVAGVAAAAASGAATYWVCEGTAVIVSGAACTVVAPGVGTVGCGAAGGVSAAPVCAAGGVAVAAAVTAVAALPACQVRAQPTGPDCGQDEYRQLAQAKDAACNNLPTSCTNLLGVNGGHGASVCIGLSGRRGEFQKCLDARNEVINRCFDGKATDDGHAEQLTSMQKLIDACDQALASVCPST